MKRSPIFQKEPRLSTLRFRRIGALQSDMNRARFWAFDGKKNVRKGSEDHLLKMPVFRIRGAESLMQRGDVTLGYVFLKVDGKCHIFKPPVNSPSVPEVTSSVAHSTPVRNENESDKRHLQNANFDVYIIEGKRTCLHGPELLFLFHYYFVLLGRDSLILWKSSQEGTKKQPWDLQLPIFFLRARHLSRWFLSVF